MHLTVLYLFDHRCNVKVTLRKSLEFLRKNSHSLLCLLIIDDEMFSKHWFKTSFSKDFPNSKFKGVYHHFDINDLKRNIITEKNILDKICFKSENNYVTSVTLESTSNQNYLNFLKQKPIFFITYFRSWQEILKTQYYFFMHSVLFHRYRPQNLYYITSYKANVMSWTLVSIIGPRVDKKKISF